MDLASLFHHRPSYFEFAVSMIPVIFLLLLQSTIWILYLLIEYRGWKIAPLRWLILILNSAIGAALTLFCTYLFFINHCVSEDWNDRRRIYDHSKPYPQISYLERSEIPEHILRTYQTLENVCAYARISARNHIVGTAPNTFWYELPYCAIQKARFSREEMIELNLNHAYWGKGPTHKEIYGLKAAAIAYFSKAPIDLTLEESESLFLLLRGPEHWSPYRCHQRFLKGLRVRLAMTRNRNLRNKVQEKMLSLAIPKFQGRVSNQYCPEE